MSNLQGNEKREYVGHMFSRIAQRYDFMNTIMTGGLHHRWRRNTAKQATVGLEGIALDVATGTGDLALALAQMHGINSTIGIDLVPEMIKLANAKISKRNCTNRISFVVGDALALPFPDNTFACVTSGFSLRNLPDLRESLKQMIRVIKPGGRLVSLEIGTIENWLFKHLFEFYFNRVVPIVGTIIGNDKEAYTYLPNSVNYFPSAEVLADSFREMGLHNVGYKRLGIGTPIIHWGTKE